MSWLFFSVLTRTEAKAEVVVTVWKQNGCAQQDNIDDNGSK